jgi:hypothetical protein
MPMMAAVHELVVHGVVWLVLPQDEVLASVWIEMVYLVEVVRR